MPLTPPHLLNRTSASEDPDSSPQYISEDSEHPFPSPSLTRSSLVSPHDEHGKPTQSPFEKLPTELISDIFYKGVDNWEWSGRPQMMSMRRMLTSWTNVCVRWREIITSTPKLWDRIYLNMDISPPFLSPNDPRSLSLETLEVVWSHVLARSKDLPLDLAFYYNFTYAPEEHELAPYASLIKQIVIPHLHRCRRLVIFMNYGPLYSTFFPLLDTFPFLEFIQFKLPVAFLGEPPSILCLIGNAVTPSLRSISVLGGRMEALMGVDASALTTIQIGPAIQSMTGSAVVDLEDYPFLHNWEHASSFLRGATAVEKLVLGIRTTPLRFPPAPTTLESVIFLAVVGLQWGSELDVPNVRKLHLFIRWLAEDEDRILLNIGLWGGMPKLEYLVLDSAAITDERILLALSFLPTVKHLKLELWANHCLIWFLKKLGRPIQATRAGGDPNITYNPLPPSHPEYDAHIDEDSGADYMGDAFLSSLRVLEINVKPQTWYSAPSLDSRMSWLLSRIFSARPFIAIRVDGTQHIGSDALDNHTLDELDELRHEGLRIGDVQDFQNICRYK